MALLALGVTRWAIVERRLRLLLEIKSILLLALDLPLGHVGQNDVRKAA